MSSAAIQNERWGRRVLKKNRFLITQVLEVIKDNKYATDEEIKAIDKRVKQLVNDVKSLLTNLDYPPISNYTIGYDQEDLPVF